MSVIGKHLFTLKVYVAAAAAVAAATFFRSTVKCLLQIKSTLPTFPSLIHCSPRPPTPLLVGVCTTTTNTTNTHVLSPSRPCCSCCEYEIDFHVKCWRLLCPVRVHQCFVPHLLLLKKRLSRTSALKVWTNDMATNGRKCIVAQIKKGISVVKCLLCTCVCWAQPSLPKVIIIELSEKYKFTSSRNWLNGHFTRN